MGKPNVQDALDNVEMTYQELIEIANDMLSELFSPVTNLVQTIGDDINNLSSNQIKDYMWKLQYKAYLLSETKEKSALKAELSESLRKERYASAFNEAQGSAAVKDNIALLGSSEEAVVESLYNLISNLIKNKVDQLHRMVNVLSSILISRMQEAKLSSVAAE